MRKASMLASVIAVATVGLGCTKAPTAPVAAVEDKVYVVLPDAVRVKAGILSGEFTGMKVTERVEAGTGTVMTPAKLSGKLQLKNNSTDQTVRLLGATVQYIDSRGERIKIEEKRIEPSFKFSNYGNAERLDPGQDSTQSMDIDFPAEALKLKRLKEIRLDLTYIPSAYKEETLNFAVSIGGQ